MYQIWKLLGYEAASIGTLGVKSRDFNIQTNNTTLCPIQLHKILNKLSKLKISNLAIEASSHGIDQSRLDDISLESACFTNLGSDHMDYHKSVSDYSKTCL